MLISHIKVKDGVLFALLISQRMLIDNKFDSYCVFTNIDETIHRFKYYESIENVVKNTVTLCFTSESNINLIYQLIKNTILKIQ